MNDFSRPIDIKEGGRVSYGADDGLLVEFHMRPVLMENASKEQAHPVYQDRIFTRIVSPGNTKTTWDHQTKGITYDYDDEGTLSGYTVADEDGQIAEPNKYPKAWERFVKKDQKVKEGWDVTEWGAITRSFAETLKAQNIHTVEALASLSDANAANIMGGQKFRNLAKAALDEQNLLSLASVEQEKAAKAESENAELRKQLDAMQRQISALSAKKQAAA
jgi:hypothetical protein